jgi:hypothetical protein
MVAFVLVAFSALQMDTGEINIVQIVMHLLAVGVSATAIYKGTDFLSWLYWLVTNKDADGRAKAGCSVILALIATPIIYGLVLVDGGLITYDYRGLLAVFGLSFMTAWTVYQRSKYKDEHSGPPIAVSAGLASANAVPHEYDDIPFYD